MMTKTLTCTSVDTLQLSAQCHCSRIRHVKTRVHTLYSSILVVGSYLNRQCLLKMYVYAYVSVHVLCMYMCVYLFLELFKRLRATGRTFYIHISV